MIANDEEQAKENKTKKKETFVVFLLISMFVILVLCIVWLVYSSTRSSSSLSGYEDVSCSSSDVRCLSLLCPDGARWSQDEQQCLVWTEFICCADVANIFKCFHPAEEETARCFKFAYEGVLYPGYKQFCREGWLWVPWKRKCLRRKTDLWGQGHNMD